MTKSAQFERQSTEWLAQIGEPAATDPLNAAVARAKNKILYDVSAGTVPRSVMSFADLHDYVDANAYGDAFAWPDLPTETNDEAYVIAHCNFWNEVQERLHQWITSGQMRNELASRAH